MYKDGSYDIIVIKRTFINTEGKIDIISDSKLNQYIAFSKIDLRFMSHQERYNALRKFWDDTLYGNLNDHFMLSEMTMSMGNPISGLFYENSKLRRYYLDNACQSFGNTNYSCSHNTIAEYTTMSSSQTFTYSVRNTNRLALVTTTLYY